MLCGVLNAIVYSSLSPFLCPLFPFFQLFNPRFGRRVINSSSCLRTTQLALGAQPHNGHNALVKSVQEKKMRGR